MNDTEAGPEVRVETGTLCGLSRAGQHAFLGIPYSAPPLGPLRWRPPQPAASWIGVRDATRLPPQAPQPGRDATSVYAEYAGDQAQSEDCLTLNVWAPAGARGARLPVMVWLHGGGFRQGAATNPIFTEGTLPLAGVVLVTVAYRLGALGFLTHPLLAAESGCSGNYGLLDQVAALAWIHRNIAAFGGDPDCVTIFGQSAGAHSIGMLMAAQAAQGLFHRAIMMSFGAVGAMRDRTAAERDGAQDTARLAPDLAGLRALPAERLVAATFPTLGPIIDGALLPESGAAAFANGRQARVPLLLGWTADEGTTFAGPTTLADHRARVAAAFGTRAEAFHALYPAGDSAEAMHADQEWFADRTFRHNILRTAEAHRTHAPTWLYHFTRVQPFHPGQRFREADPATRLGAFHSGDYPYVFGTLDVLDRAWTEADREFAATMQALWVSFARDGAPAAPGVTWPAWDGGDLMELGERSGAAPVPHRARLAFHDAPSAAATATSATRPA